MTELDKIEYAKSFIDKLANGINPLDDSKIPDDDIVNNVRLSRCFFYVSDILRQVIENGGIKPERRSRSHKKEFILTDEEKARIQISDEPVHLSEIARRLNELVDLETTKKIKLSEISDWLLELQLLEEVVRNDGKHRKRPTEQGRELGIFTEVRSGEKGTYTVILYSNAAQQFIYDNIDAVIYSKTKK